MASGDNNILTVIKKTKIQDLVVLCGSGISYSSPASLPTVKSFYNACIKNAKLSEKLKTILIDKLNISTIEPRFEVILNEIRIYLDHDLHILRIYDDPQYNVDHYYLAQFLSRGGNVITTNFDHCIENANTVGNFNKVVFSGQQNTSYLKRYPGTLIKPHGCILQKDRTKLIATITALTDTTAGYRYYKQWRKLILGFLKDKTIIVLGYSGSDDFDIMPMLESSKHKKCIWVNYDATQITPVKYTSDKALQKKIHKIRNCQTYKGIYQPIYQAIAKTGSIVIGPSGTTSKITFLNLLSDIFKSEERRLALSNFILFYHKLYSEIIAVNNSYLKKDSSKLILMQNIMARYRLGDYKGIIKEVDNFRYVDGFSTIDLMIQHHLSPCHYYLGNEEKALAILDQFKANCRKASNIDFLLEALFLEGSIYSNKNDTEPALTAFSHAESILKGFKNFEMEGKLYWALGDLNQRQNKLNVALTYFNKANKLYLKIRNQTSLLFINLNRSGVLLDLGHLRMGHEVLVQAEEGLSEYSFNAPGGSHISVYIYFLRAQYYRRKNKTAEFCEEMDKLMQTVRHCPGHPYLSYIVIISYLVNKLHCSTIAVFKRIQKNRSVFLIHIQSNSGTIPTEVGSIFKQLLSYPINDLLKDEIKAFFNKRYYY